MNIKPPIAITCIWWILLKIQGSHQRRMLLLIVDVQFCLWIAPRPHSRDGQENQSNRLAHRAHVCVWQCWSSHFRRESSYCTVKFGYLVNINKDTTMREMYFLDIPFSTGSLKMDLLAVPLAGQKEIMVHPQHSACRGT